MSRAPTLFAAVLLGLAACHQPRTTPAYPGPPPVLAPAPGSLVPAPLHPDTSRATRPDSLREAAPSDTAGSALHLPAP